MLHDTRDSSLKCAQNISTFLCTKKYIAKKYKAMVHNNMIMQKIIVSQFVRQSRAVRLCWDCW